MDWEKYPLAIKNNRNNPLIVVYPDNSTKELNLCNIVIKEPKIKLITKDVFQILDEYSISDKYNRISTGRSLDIRDQEDRLDYVRDLYYSPDYDIAIVDSESFLELRYGDFELIYDIVKSESDLTQFSSKKIVTSEEQQCIEGMLHKIGIDATLSGYSKDKENNFFIRYETDEGKNLYIDYNLQLELVKELSLSNESINIDSNISKKAKENDIDIEF